MEQLVTPEQNRAGDAVEMQYSTPDPTARTKSRRKLNKREKKVWPRFI